MECRGKLPKVKLALYWPFDFTTQGKLLALRSTWSPAYDGGWSDIRRLKGGKEIPSWKELPLPPTHTSSGMIMVQGVAGTMDHSTTRRAKSELWLELSPPYKKARFINQDTVEEQTQEAQVEASATNNDFRQHLLKCLAYNGADKKTIADLEAAKAKQRAVFLEDYNSLHAEWHRFIKAKNRKLDSDLEISVKKLKRSEEKAAKLEKKVSRIETQSQRCEISLKKKQMEGQARLKDLLKILKAVEELNDSESKPDESDYVSDEASDGSDENAVIKDNGGELKTNATK